MIHSNSGKRWFLMLFGLLILTVFLIPMASAQTSKVKDGKHTLAPVVVHSIKNDMSPTLRALCVNPNLKMPKQENEQERLNPGLPKVIGKTPEISKDPVVNLQTKGTFATPPTLGTFEGMNNKDNYYYYGLRVLPPDTEGAVSPTYYLEWVNLVISVYAKDGTRLFGPIAGNAIWTGFGGPCEATNDGDPIVQYDQLADRWLISQFSTATPYTECVAISQSGDPSGAYYRYEFPWPNSNFPDYPKIGVWADGYYMSANQFYQLSSWGGAAVASFERDKMLLGQPARMVYFDLLPVEDYWGGMTVASVEGPPPPAGAPAYFAEVDDSTWLPLPDPDGLRIWEFHVDWADPTSSTFGLDGEPNYALFPANFNPLPCAGVNRWCIPQPDTTVKVDAIPDRLMFSMQYRNYGTHEDLVVNHTVWADGTDRAGVRLYKVLLSGTSECASYPCLGLDTTQAPADGLYRFMGSAAQDGAGNLCLGYSISGTTAPWYPSLSYACWSPTGTYDGEQTMFMGTGSQTYNNASQARWGDYSALHVDPLDDCTFWYTQEYYAQTGETCPINPSTACWHTRIGSFRYPSCVAPAKCKFRGYVYDNNTFLPIPNALVKAGGYSRITDNYGYYEIQVSPGAYDMEAIVNKYSTGTATGLNCSGSFLNHDFYLDGIPLAVYESNSYADSCALGGAGNGDGYIDPGETVTIKVKLKNDGAADVADATGIMTSTSTEIDIFDPNGAWPVITAGTDAENNDTFAFTVAPDAECGSMIDTSLDVSYTGGSPLSQNITFTVGQLSTSTILLSETFDSGIPSTWTVVDGGACSGGDQYTWNTVDYAPRDVTAPLSYPYAIADSDNNGSACGDMDEQLITPSFDATGCAQVRFSFSNQYASYNTDYNVAVAVSTDGGTTWNTALSMTGADDGYPTPDTKEVNITSYAAGQSDVQVRFHYATNWGGWWAVDNVEVLCYQAVCHTCAAPSALTPHHLEVDEIGNGVFEPDETVVVEPAWRNDESSAVTMNGTISAFNCSPGQQQLCSMLDSYAQYGSIAPGANGSCDGTGDCYVLKVRFPDDGVRPATHWDTTMVETLSGTFSFAPPTHTWKLHIGNSFTDVPHSNVFYPYIENMLHNSITSGCTGYTYCPNTQVSREQMAKFICAAMNKKNPGSCTTAPCAGIFSDVPSSNVFCPYIEALYNASVVSGCATSPLRYCPGSVTQRQAMAKFICLSMNAVSPGSCTTASCAGIFSDVPSSNVFCPYIEGIYNAGVVAGCSTSPLSYCPNNNVNRDQMAKYLTNAFQLLLYGP